MATRKKTISEVMSENKPASTVKEMLDLFNKLIKYPSTYLTTGGKKPRTKADYQEGLSIGLNYEGELHVTKAMEKILSKDQVYEYKGKLYMTTYWNDNKENYRGANIEIVKPIKVK